MEEVSDFARTSGPGADRGSGQVFPQERISDRLGGQNACNIVPQCVETFMEDMPLFVFQECAVSFDPQTQEQIVAVVKFSLKNQICVESGMAG